MPTITRRFEWDSGHRVLGHEGKCKHLHGHRYVAEVTVTSPELDSLGRVIDFSVIKEIVGGWIDSNWDHNMLLHPADPLVNLWTTDSDGVFAARAPYIMPMVGVAGDLHPAMVNPTAENLARVLYTQANQLLRSKEVEVQRVRLYETPNCWSDYPNVALTRHL